MGFFNKSKERLADDDSDGERAAGDEARLSKSGKTFGFLRGKKKSDQKQNQSEDGHAYDADPEKPPEVQPEDKQCQLATASAEEDRHPAETGDKAEQGHTPSPKVKGGAPWSIFGSPKRSSQERQQKAGDSSGFVWMCESCGGDNPVAAAECTNCKADSGRQSPSDHSNACNQEDPTALPAEKDLVEGSPLAGADAAGNSPSAKVSSPSHFFSKVGGSFGKKGAAKLLDDDASLFPPSRSAFDTFGAEGSEPPQAVLGAEGGPQAGGEAPAGTSPSAKVSSPSHFFSKLGGSFGKKGAAKLLDEQLPPSDPPTDGDGQALPGGCPSPRGSGKKGSLLLRKTGASEAEAEDGGLDDDCAGGKQRGTLAGLKHLSPRMFPRGRPPPRNPHKKCDEDPEGIDDSCLDDDADVLPGISTPPPDAPADATARAAPKRGAPSPPSNPAKPGPADDDEDDLLHQLANSLNATAADGSGVQPGADCDGADGKADYGGALGESWSAAHAKSTKLSASAKLRSFFPAASSGSSSVMSPSRAKQRRRSSHEEAASIAAASGNGSDDEDAAGNTNNSSFSISKAGSLSASAKLKAVFFGGSGGSKNKATRLETPTDELIDPEHPLTADGTFTLAERGGDERSPADDSVFASAAQGSRSLFQTDVQPAAAPAAKPEEELFPASSRLEGKSMSPASGRSSGLRKPGRPAPAPGLNPGVIFGDPCSGLFASSPPAASSPGYPIRTPHNTPMVLRPQQSSSASRGRMESNLWTAFEGYGSPASPHSGRAAVQPGSAASPAPALPASCNAASPSFSSPQGASSSPQPGWTTF
ncbi:hypothetical protein DIPPA_27275 [Diplonema papillatum]|nr:hypothetical protein DIPPA_27275 [Diplonema papillatum]